MRWAEWIWVGVALSAAAGTGACGSSEDCEETRTCGSGSGASGGLGGAAGGGGGVAGSGATGGSAGAGGGQPCSTNTECDDGKACTGTESCSGGKCQSGKPVSCPNPDALHCVGECIESAGTAVCRVIGKDVDNDTHKDAACAQSEVLADDCDDGNDQVHPAASEACDGLDNDCNGTDELDEGASVTGSAATLVTTSAPSFPPVIAWSPTAKHYAVVFSLNFSGGFEVALVRMAPDGSKLGAAGSEVVQVSNAAGDSMDPRVAWGHGSWGIVWSDPHGQSTEKIYFRRMDSDGKPTSAELQVSSAASTAFAPDIAPTSTGWAVVWWDTRSKNGGEVYGRLLNADGTPNGTEKLLGTQGTWNREPHLASNGAELFLTWSLGTAVGTLDVVKGARVGFDLGVIGEQSLTAAAPATGTGSRLAHVAPTSSGWSLAWRDYTSTTSSIAATELKGDATSACTPLSLAAGADGAPGGVATRGGRSLIAYVRDAGAAAKIELVRTKPGCAGPITYDIATDSITPNEPRNASVAWGDSGAALVWSDGLDVHRWVTGPNLCDAPQ